MIRYELIWVVRKAFFSNDDKQQMQIFRINAASGAASLVIFKCIEKSCLDPWTCIKTPSSSAEMSFTSNAIVFAVLQKKRKHVATGQNCYIRLMQCLIWCTAPLFHNKLSSYQRKMLKVKTEKYYFCYCYKSLKLSTDDWYTQHLCVSCKS